jgi:CRP-like cAMP-binding protein
MNIIDVMRTMELFRGLSQHQLERLAEITQRETFAEGEAILNMNQLGDRMYILAQGQVEIHVPTGGGMQPVLFLGEGQVFGEVALLDEGRRSASVIAAEDDTIVYSIPRDEFTRLCQTDTQLGYLVMRNLALDLSFKLRHRNLV